mmetsp:Transcript_96501/g.191204  ORF Transcript_96501/g.191204 Transcript_96501/m.191204 type:complete len:231 (-) Transcript_96501:64-756(-)
MESGQNVNDSHDHDEDDQERPDLNQQLSWPVLNQQPKSHRWIVLSVKYDNDIQGGRYGMGQTPNTVASILGASQAYNPNEVNKEGDCDKDDCWSAGGCMARNLVDDKPTDKSCWKQSFFWHLKQLPSDGCMLRILETDKGWGKGQEIEAQMAEFLEVEMKVLRIKSLPPQYQTEHDAAWAAEKCGRRWRELIKLQRIFFVSLRREFARLGLVPGVDADLDKKGHFDNVPE